MADITDDIAALDFDLACGARLIFYDQQVAKAMYGTKDDESGDYGSLGDAEIHDLIRNDPWADENTRVS